MKWGLLRPLYSAISVNSRLVLPLPLPLFFCIFILYIDHTTTAGSPFNFQNISFSSSPVRSLPVFDSKVRVDSEVFNSDGEESFSENDYPIHYAAYVANAVATGVKDATELFEKIEPELYRKNVIIEGNHPSAYLAAINRQAPKAKELSRVAYATLRATTVLKESLAQFRDEIHENALLRRTVMQRSSCPNRRQLDDECVQISQKYRTIDGTCNNLKNPYIGSSFQPFARFLPPEYDDGVSEIRKSISGKDLPSARLISTSIHKDVSRPSSSFTLMLMQWGQFIDHDLTATSQTRAFNHSVPKCCNVSDIHPDCLPIKILPNDPYFNKSDCMEFIRSSPAPRLDCTMGPREQLNQLTSWLDGSVVYGSTAGDLQPLRLFQKGHLKYSHMPNRKALLPQLVHPPENECIISSPRLYCFAAGDGRVNEQPGLTTMHTIWLRQHNILADKLHQVNSHWDDETLFQESRKILIAQLQHITYREFLPFILGPDVLKAFRLRLQRSGYYDGYNESNDATVPNAFGAAAFRFGHSLVQPKLHRCDENHREMPYKIELSHEMMSPSNIHNLGEVDRISLGLSSQRSQRRDEFITTQLTNHLFQTQGHQGLDLAAINIQRGRDHGLPPYLKWREGCGLLKPLTGNENQTVSTWKDFGEATEIPKEKVEWFASIYENPWDVDLFPGAMVEYPVKGGILGPTFSCILGQTFLNIRRGDRFWYENPTEFSPIQLQNIRNMSLSRVICDTSDGIRTMQPIVFLLPHDKKNPRVNCTNFDAIPQLDFSAWKEESLPLNLNAISREDLEDIDIESDSSSSKPIFYSLLDDLEISSNVNFEYNNTFSTFPLDELCEKDIGY